MNVATQAGPWRRRLRESRRLTSVALLVVALATGLLFVNLALASVSHVFTASFGAAGSTPANPYPLLEPTDVEVDQTSHDVYVTDPGHYRIEKFDSSGNFLLMFGKGVNKTAVEESATRAAEENFCPAAGHPGDVCQAGAPSSTPGAFETPAYLAVDNTSGSPSQGDIYVADTGTNLVQKFDFAGRIVSSWGAVGQKDGSDTDLSHFGPLFGLAVGGPNGDLYVGGNRNTSDNVFQYTQDGTYQGPYQNTTGTPWLKADPSGNIYFVAIATIIEGVLRPGTHGIYDRYQMVTDTPVTGFGFDPSSQELYQDTGSVIDHYSPSCNPPVTGVCEPIDSFGSGKLSGPSGVAVDGTSHTVYVANSASGDVAAFGDARPIVTTSAPTGVTESSVTLHGHIDPASRGDITSCRFDYGFDKSYGATVLCTPDPASSNFTGPTDVTATITGLSPGTRDHYRLVVSNTAEATSQSLDQTFITTQPPSIDGLASANLTATSADLNAQVNPNGLETTYRFEYGTTISYGQSAPVPDGTIGASNSDQAIGVHLDNLQTNVVYHYRLLATNADGTTTGADQTFNFYPPGCPNENVRQQTQANYLPDCRAYELVSPGNAGGTQLYPGGPNTGQATDPSRLSYTGLFGAVPGSGGNPIDGNGDLYVATRTNTGWVSRYVGLPASLAAVDGGPTQGLPGIPGLNNGATGFDPVKVQNEVLTDQGMSRFLDWNDGNQSVGSNFTYDFSNPAPMASNAPYVWDADGGALDRWPTNLGTVETGTHTHIDVAGNITEVQPGGVHALDCPMVPPVGFFGDIKNYCPGDVTASADLSHFVFASKWNQFAPEGQLSAPGSVYDNDTVAKTVIVASRLQNGEPIPAEPNDLAGGPLRIPFVSSDGSHILMAAGETGACGLPTCTDPPCVFYDIADQCPFQPSHLYMRVSGTATYDVSQGSYVDYIASTASGSKVYFTSKEQLTAEDHDTSTDLYMWSQATDSLSVISIGDGGTGNTDLCSTSFTTKCGIVPYSNRSFCQLASGVGGNCLSDNFIASRSGDIYFFSPEQLDGSRGIPRQENLYVYRNGDTQYVATFTSGPFCKESTCSDTPIVRMQVSPEGDHTAFVTASQVTSYNSAGHLEMYTYEPATRNLICVSCLPSGAPPTSNMEASQDGLFMTDNGRAFFSTEDALVHADTNHAQDVYEYADGRPQLITPGTGDTRQPSAGSGFSPNLPGLVGVSANGTDVYFSAYDTLVRQDHNGLFLKLYDARSGGGFPAPAPPPPCDAADECHDPGTSQPAALQNGTSANLGSGGNVSSKAGRHRKKKHHRHRHGHPRAASANSGVRR